MGAARLTDAAPLGGDAPITPAWLTAVLREAGVLTAGSVHAITERPNDAFNSIITHLAVTYSPDAPAAAPARLLLKRNLAAAWAVHDAEREVAFYRFVAPLMDDLPMLVRCYAATFDPARGASHILMDDCSETHIVPISREQVLALDGVPDTHHLDGIIDALARFHAFWWNHPALGEGVTAVHGWYDSRAAYDTFVEEVAANWERFIAAEAGSFPDELRALYADALTLLPSLWERSFARRVATCANLTMSNGDSYFAQFLCPKLPGAGQTFIIDFQNPKADFAALDLVYLFATFWTPEQRREGGREERLLRRYLARLHASGVVGFGWDDLMTDYRLMIVLMIFFPLWDRVNGSRREYWWPKMQCLTGAYRDLDCHALLGPIAPR
jgi:hypothetical protein